MLLSATSLLCQTHSQQKGGIVGVMYWETHKSVNFKNTLFDLSLKNR